MPRGPKEWSPRKALIVASVKDAVSVILNGTTVYHDEKGERDFRNNNFPAEEVGRRLSEATGMPVVEVGLVPGRDVPMDWNFDDVEHAAIMRAGRTG